MVCHDKSISRVLYQVDIYTNADSPSIWSHKKEIKISPAIKILYTPDISLSNVTRYWTQHETGRLKFYSHYELTKTLHALTLRASYGTPLIIIHSIVIQENAFEAIVYTTVAIWVPKKISISSQYEYDEYRVVRYGDSDYKIRLSWDLPICIMRKPILVSRYLILRQPPGFRVNIKMKNFQ